MPDAVNTGATVSKISVGISPLHIVLSVILIVPALVISFLDNATSVVTGEEEQNGSVASIVIVATLPGFVTGMTTENVFVVPIGVGVT